MNFLRTLPKEKLQRLVLACLVALVGTGLVVQFYTLKELQSLSESRAKLAVLQTQISDAEAASRQAVQAEPMCKQMQVFIETQEARMISGDPFAWAVRELTLVAEQHPVRILNWQLGAKGQQAQKPAYATIVVHIDVSGRYDEIGHFLEDLENKFPTGQILSLNLGGTAIETGVHQVAIEFSLLVRPAAKQEKAS